MTSHRTTSRQSPGLQVRVPAPYVTAVLIVVHVYLAAGYLAGPERLTSSGSYTVMLALAPPPAWGAALLAAAACTAVAPWTGAAVSTALHALAMVPPLAMSAALVAAQLARYSQGWGGAGLLLLPVLLHGALAWARIERELRHG